MYSFMLKKYQLQCFTKVSYHESLYANILIYQKSKKSTYLYFEEAGRCNALFSFNCPCF